MRTSPEQLYEEDFYAWTRQQAAALRRWQASRPDVELDLAHVAGEIADLGKEQRGTRSAAGPPASSSTCCSWSTPRPPSRAGIGHAR